MQQNSIQSSQAVSPKKISLDLYIIYYHTYSYTAKAFRMKTVLNIHIIIQVHTAPIPDKLNQQQLCGNLKPWKV